MGGEEGGLDDLFSSGRVPISMSTAYLSSVSGTCTLWLL